MEHKLTILVHPCVCFRPSTAVARVDKNQEKDNLTRDQIRIRRHMGYAAAERRLAQKTIDLCLIEEPDVIGIPLLTDYNRFG